MKVKIYNLLLDYQYISEEIRKNTDIAKKAIKRKRKAVREADDVFRILA